MSNIIKLDKSQSLLNEVKFPTSFFWMHKGYEYESQSLLNEVKFPTNLK